MFWLSVKNFALRRLFIKAPSTRIRIFFFFPDTASVYTCSVNPTYESATFWIRSPELKFLNTLWVWNSKYAKSGYFFIWWCDKIEPSFLPWILYSRWQPRSQVLSLTRPGTGRKASQGRIWLNDELQNVSILRLALLPVNILRGFLWFVLHSTNRKNKHYRLTPILPCFSKFLERIVYNRIIIFPQWFQCSMWQPICF